MFALVQSMCPELVFRSAGWSVPLKKRFVLGRGLTPIDVKLACSDILFPATMIVLSKIIENYFQILLTNLGLRIFLNCILLTNIGLSIFKKLYTADKLRT